MRPAFGGDLHEQSSSHRQQIRSVVDISISHSDGELGGIERGRISLIEGEVNRREGDVGRVVHWQEVQISTHCGDENRAVVVQEILVVRCFDKGVSIEE